jgi:hypothetical protein
MLPLWRARTLGDALSEEDDSTAVNPQCPSKIECTSAGSKQSWLDALQPWEAEPSRGRSSLGNTRHGSRYVLSRISPCRSVI